MVNVFPHGGNSPKKVACVGWELESKRKMEDVRSVSCHVRLSHMQRALMKSV